MFTLAFCCGRKTCLNNSSSIQGAYLVCGRCAWDKFGNWYNCRKWQEKNLLKVLSKEKKGQKIFYDNH